MINILFFISSLILSIIGFLILNQINTLGCKLKSLFLIYETLFSQNIENISRLSKFQKNTDEIFIVTVDAHPVFPVSLSTDDTLLVLTFLVCGFFWYAYTFWPLSVKSASSFGCVKSSFLAQKNIISLKFRDSYRYHVYSVNFNESNQTYEVGAQIGQEKFYLLQDYYQLYPKAFVPKSVILYEITCRTSEDAYEFATP